MNFEDGFLYFVAPARVPDFAGLNVPARSRRCARASQPHAGAEAATSASGGGLDDRDELGGRQAGAADQGAVDVTDGEQ